MSQGLRKRMDRIEKDQENEKKKQELFDKRFEGIEAAYSERSITLREHDERMHALHAEFAEDELAHSILDFTDAQRLDWMVENVAKAGEGAFLIGELMFFGFAVECEDGRRSLDVKTSARAAIDSAMRGEMSEADGDEDDEDDFVPF